MSEYKFSEKAYAKMIFHAAKYPHLAINGVLLSEKSSNTSSKLVQIVDAIPLFHQCLYVTPMAEIALMQVDAFAERNNLTIAGYYAAAQNFDHNTLQNVPAIKMAEKIYENNKNACLVIIDNQAVSLSQTYPAIIVHSSSGDTGARWTKTKFTLEQSDTTLEAVSALLQRGVMKDLVDFDNHLDNPENDWTNEFLNKDLQKIMAMY